MYRKLDNLRIFVTDERVYMTHPYESNKIQSRRCGDHDWSKQLAVFEEITQKEFEDSIKTDTYDNSFFKVAYLVARNNLK